MYVCRRAGLRHVPLALRKEDLWPATALRTTCTTHASSCEKVALFFPSAAGLTSPEFLPQSSVLPLSLSFPSLAKRFSGLWGLSGDPHESQPTWTDECLR